MGWVARRADHLGSATFGGAGGITFSQAPAFTQAYLQRLGGHVDEAQRTVDQIASGQMLPWLSAERRADAVAELQLRLDELLAFQSGLLETPALLRPLMIVRHGEWDIARRAAEAFTPAVPIDLASLTWTAVGIVTAVILYELCKTPAWAVRRRRENVDKQRFKG